MGGYSRKFAFERYIGLMTNPAMTDPQIAIPSRAPSATTADDTVMPFEVAKLDLRGRVVVASYDSTYEAMAGKFVDHFLWIAAAMNRPGAEGMWDEEDGFYYDILRLPDGSSTRLKVRSMVGLLPLCAATVIE